MPIELKCFRVKLESESLCCSGANLMVFTGPANTRPYHLYNTLLGGQSINRFFSFERNHLNAKRSVVS
jgi:hypothetical protein